MTLFRKTILPQPLKEKHTRKFSVVSKPRLDCGKDSPPPRGRDSRLSPGVLLTRWWPWAPAEFWGLHFPFCESWRGGLAGLSGPA